MTFLEYKTVMDELNIPKMNISRDVDITLGNTNLKFKPAAKIHDCRLTKHGFCFLYYKRKAICLGEIPTIVVKATYDRIGDECFGRIDSESYILKYEDLRWEGYYIDGFTFGNLRHFLVFYDTYLRHAANNGLYEEDVEGIDINETYARIVAKLFGKQKKRLSVSPRNLVSIGIIPYSLQPETRQDTDKEIVGKLLDEYDKAVNPTLDNLLEFSDIYAFAKKNNMQIGFHKLLMGHYGRDRIYNDFSRFENDSTSMIFNSALELKKSKDKDKKAFEGIFISHCFTKKRENIDINELDFDDEYKEKYNGEFKPTELLHIHRVDENNETIYTVEYDLTNGTVGTCEGFEVTNKHNITKEDLQRLAADLKDALAVIKERNKNLSSDHGDKVLSLENKEQNN